MVPSTKSTRLQLGMKQSKIVGFGRITKAAPAAVSQKACHPRIAPAVRLHEPPDSCPVTSKKRKHDAPDGASDSENGEQIEAPVLKKPRLQRPPSESSSQVSFGNDTSPVSSKSSCTSLGSLDVQDQSSTSPVTTTTLPLTLKTILALHENFLKALSIHFAHNGLSAPAELSSLLKTVTCLWKKYVVRTADIQRMLALYEISVEQDQSATFRPDCNVAHREGPFQLTASGAPGNRRVCVEYVGARDLYAAPGMRSPFSEKDLQHLFELDLLCLYRASRHKPNTHLSFLSGPLAGFPLLSCTLGTQSAIRQDKSSARRIEILSISNASQQRQQKKPSTQAVAFPEATHQTEIEAAKAVMSRTRSLFDRIAAKQAVETSSGAPTAANILRRHAVGRISEIVEILRMKQHQKSGGRNHLLSNTNGSSPTKLGQRVSFSMKQLQMEIKDSASVPLGDEEIKLSLKILAEQDSTKKWLKLLDSGVGDGASVFVVLEGCGMPGRDVQKLLEMESRGEVKAESQPTTH